MSNNKRDKEGTKHVMHCNCNENHIFAFLFWELRGLSPNFHIRVSEDMSENERSWAMSENERDQEGIKHATSMNVRAMTCLRRKESEYVRVNTMSEKESRRVYVMSTNESLGYV